MNIETITSRQNELLSHIKKLQSSRSYRYKEGQFTADGSKLLEEAIACGAEILAVVHDEDYGIPLNIPKTARVCRVSGKLMEYVSAMDTPQGIITVCAMPSPPEDFDPSGAVILDGIQDPGNVGTLLRTADAMGIRSVAAVNACADIYNPKTVRATMGAVFRLPVFSCDADELMSRIKEKGVKLVASALTETAGDIRQTDLSGCAVVIGSEASGVSERLLNAADETVIIPMSHKSESLNAAVAGSIIMWEMRRKNP